MNSERKRLTDDQLDAMAEAFHLASELHADNLSLYGDEAGDLVTIEEYDEAFRAVGLWFLGARRRMMMAQSQLDQEVIDLATQKQRLPEDPTYCNHV